MREKAEDLRGRIDNILEHQDGELNKQLKLKEIKLERSKAKKEENEAFARRVEAGGYTELAQAEFELAKAQAKVRKIKDEQKIEKTRSKAEAARKRSAAQIGQPAEETMRRKRKKNPRISRLSGNYYAPTPRGEGAGA